MRRALSVGLKLPRLNEVELRLVEDFVGKKKVLGAGHEGRGEEVPAFPALAVAWESSPGPLPADPALLPGCQRHVPAAGTFAELVIMELMGRSPPCPNAFGSDALQLPARRQRGVGALPGGPVPSSWVGAVARSPAAGRWLSPSPPGAPPAPLPRQEEGSQAAVGKAGSAARCIPAAIPQPLAPAELGEGPGGRPGLCARLGTWAAPGPSCSSTSVQIAVVSRVLARLCPL